MAVLRVNKNYCQLKDPDIDFLWKLDRELSYMVPGAQYTKAYKGYRKYDGTVVKWDGKARLLECDLRFPFGLKGRVEGFYKKNKKPLTIEDHRPPLTNRESIDLTPRLKAMDRSPYQYQLDAVNAAVHNDCGIIKISTGGGKTLVAALMTAKFNDTTCIFVIGTDLLHQFHKVFSEVFDEPIGIIGDGECRISRINIVSVWSVAQVLDVKKALLEDEDDEESPHPEHYRSILDLMGSSKLNIFDECQMAAAETIQQIAKNTSPDRTYGMSASPWRDDNADLLIEAVVGRKIYEIDSSYLIDNGFLVRPFIKFIDVPRAPKFSSYQTAYSQYIVNNDARNDLIVQEVMRMVEEGRQTLVLFSTIKHGDILYKRLKGLMPTQLLSGKDSSEIRDDVKEGISAGLVRCLIASKIYDIGVDCPALSGLVLAGGGKSSVRALQRIGRVIRKFPSKKNAEVVDFMDHATYLSDHASARLNIYQMEKGFIINGSTS
jgi:superfamily II DNA or RNA helicase